MSARTRPRPRCRSCRIAARRPGWPSTARATRPAGRPRLRQVGVLPAPLPRRRSPPWSGISAADRTAGERRGLDFSPWEGAYNRVPEDATAFAHRGERFLLKHDVAVPPDATVAQHRSARDWLAASWGLVHPFGSGRVYPNFPDPDLVDWPTAYHGANLERLIRVKAAYDPDNVFRFHQSLAWDTGRRER